MYKNSKVKFIQWLIGKKLSKGHIRDINNALGNTLKFTDILELMDKLLKVKNRKYRSLALRILFNFLDEYGLIDYDLILKLKSKIKITERSGIDTFIPYDEQIEEFLKAVLN